MTEEDCIRVKILKDQTNDNLSDKFKSNNLDTIQFIPVRSIKGNRKVSDLEEEETIRCNLKFYKNYFEVICSVVDNSVVKCKPGKATNVNSNMKRVASKHEAISSNSKKNSMSKISSLQSNVSIEEKNENEFSIDEMLKLANDNKYPKKDFFFGKNKYSYTPVLHFFDCNTKFSEKPLQKIKFSCKFCKKVNIKNYF